MSYQFKVGDKGKTRYGADYEVLAISDLYPERQQIVIAIKDPTSKTWGLGQRGLDGKHPYSFEQHDLLPPTVTKYLNVWLGRDKQRADSILHVNEDSARRAAAAGTEAGFEYLAIAKPVEIPQG